MGTPIFILIVVAFIALTGILLYYRLPNDEVKSIEITFESSPEEVYNVISDIRNWEHRKDLNFLKILTENNDEFMWNEYYKSNLVIRCHTINNIANKFYSVEYNSKLYKGKRFWEFIKNEDGSTLCIITQYTYYKTLAARIQDYSSNVIVKSLHNLGLYTKNKLQESHKEESLVAYTDWGVETSSLAAMEANSKD